MKVKVLKRFAYATNDMGTTAATALPGEELDLPPTLDIQGLLNEGYITNVKGMSADAPVEPAVDEEESRDDEDDGTHRTRRNRRR